MTTDDHSRDATATILGYMYQFDSTILNLCASPHSAVVDIEAIEDFDIAASDLTDLFQCKYYEATRLTPATIRDAILPMLKGYLRLRTPDRTRRRFHLYGYFKDSVPGDSTLTLDQLKGALTRRNQVASGATTHYINIDLQKELGATDDELRAFAGQLSIHVTEKNDEHKRRTIEALRQECQVSHTEAELYVYPTARTLISTIACESDLSKRQLSRQDFVARISPSRALFNQWALREHGESIYYARIRREYFSQHNIDASYRAFILDSSLSGTESDLLALCHTLRRKWSSHGLRRKPDGERYAPIVFLRNMSEARLVTVKTSLFANGVHFVDGFPFLGATFTPEHLCTPQTYANQISLRLISSREELSKAFAYIRGERIAYDFYAVAPTEPLPTCKWVSLPATSIRSIEAIV